MEEVERSAAVLIQEINKIAAVEPETPLKWLKRSGRKNPLKEAEGWKVDKTGKAVSRSTKKHIVSGTDLIPKGVEEIQRESSAGDLKNTPRA